MTYHDVERANREELDSIQRERLVESVEHAYANVSYYRDLMDDAGLSPDAVSSLGDVGELPFTTAEHFRDAYPFGTFAVPIENVRRIHSSSGTTGKPKVVGYTRSDLDAWASVCARSMAAAGIGSDDVVQNAAGYGLFTGGLGWHDGAETLGAMVIPAGAGNTRRQIELIEDLGTDALVTIPSYALYLAETAEESGIEPAELPISTILVGAEPSSEEMRREIESRFDATVIDNYGLSEVIGPGVSIECQEAQDGLHVWEDHFYPEVVDPETGEPLPEGEEGELVLTSLTKVALPVIRYRTGDVTSLTYDRCECGRTHVRMDNVTGRVDDRLVIRGVNVYPSEIEAVLLEFDAVAPQYRLDVYRDGPLDRFEVTVERDPGVDGDADALEAPIAERLASVLALTPDEVSVVEHGGLERTEVGKAKRVYDHR